VRQTKPEKLKFFSLPKLEQLVLLRKELWVFSAFQDPICRLDRAERCCQVVVKRTGNVSSRQFTWGSFIQGCGPYKHKLQCGLLGKLTGTWEENSYINWKLAKTNVFL